MRDSEVFSLKSNCWEANNKNSIIIKGMTSKFKDSKTHVKWIGSSILTEVFEFLDFINMAVIKRFNIEAKDILLFWSSTLLENINQPDGEFVEKKIYTAKMSHLESRNAIGFNPK